MAKVKKSLLGTTFIEAIPKKTRQGSGQHTKYAAPVGTIRRRDIGDKDDNRKETFGSPF